MLLALPQDVRCSRHIHERARLNGLVDRAKSDEKMRIVGIAAAAIDARVRRPECFDGMEGERFDAVLKKQNDVPERAAQLGFKFLGLELMVMKRVRSGFLARLRVIGPVGRRDDEYSSRSQHPS